MIPKYWFRRRATGPTTLHGKFIWKPGGFILLGMIITWLICANFGGPYGRYLDFIGWSSFFGSIALYIYKTAPDDFDEDLKSD